MRTISFFGVLLCGLALPGCGLWHRAPAISDVPLGHLKNPAFIPATNREFVFNQVVDEIDDYFKIKREERVRLIGDILTEGHIETYPTVGSTALEPWRKDSVRGFERTHATLQTVRRHARVRVIPTQGGYLIDVSVFKELEDVIKPERATVGDRLLRYDDSLTRYDPEGSDEDRAGFGRGTLGWIPIGRDIALEQTILANLQGRLPQGALHGPPHADVEVSVHPRQPPR